MISHTSAILSGASFQIITCIYIYMYVYINHWAVVFITALHMDNMRHMHRLASIMKRKELWVYMLTMAGIQAELLDETLGLPHI